MTTTVTVNCPHDRVPMVPRERHGLSVHACNWCRSLWLPAPSWVELCRLARLPPVSFHTEGKSAVHPQRTCPGCVGLPLLIRHVRTIEVDVCSLCGGVWLDHDEIQRLLGLPVLGKVDLRPAPRIDQSYGKRQDGFDTIGTTGELATFGLDVLAEVVGSLLIP